MNVNRQTAVFGGGCFWCTEAVFKMLKGVVSVLPGYTGGTTPNPTYAQVSTGDTGHVEVVQIIFDPTLLKYEDLLAVFFATHDPTTLNRQGDDVGTQYRSAIFYTSTEQKEKAEKMIAEINASSSSGKPAVTEVLPLGTFYEAEAYHQDYFSNNPEESYCQVVINPKLAKIKLKFASLVDNHG